MIIQLTAWSLIRDQFTEAEKDALNEAITGQAICPRGPIVAEESLPTELRRKLLEALAAV